jgi:hypothetical protein
MLSIWESKCFLGIQSSPWQWQSPNGASNRGCPQRGHTTMAAIWNHAKTTLWRRQVQVKFFSFGYWVP